MNKTFTLLLSLLLLFSVQLWAGGKYDRDLFADKWDIEVKVFPNPSTSGTFTLQLDKLQADESLEIVVYNLIGKKIQSFRIQTQQGYFQQEVKLGNMAKGIYMLQIVKGDQKITKRLSYI
ncbi:MAG: T9SS type A sorting domain-containing protein [Bacteroidia bacterium]|nr:T9SS type A sorting domain-containing protein [Bacteroidia bacterium]